MLLDSTYRILQLKAGDEAKLQQLQHLFAEAFEMPTYAEPTETDRQRLLSQSNFIVFVALRGDEVIGGLSACELPVLTSAQPECTIYDIVVAESSRRQGVGRALIKSLLDLAKAQQYGYVYVLAEREDAPALAFYERLGAEQPDVAYYGFPTDTP